MRAMKKIFWNVFFLPPEISIFLEICNNPMHVLGREEHMFLFGNAQPKSNAHAHLKQR